MKDLNLFCRMKDRSDDERFYKPHGMIPILIRGRMTVGNTWQVNDADLPYGPKILQAWPKRHIGLQVERGRQENSKSRTFYRSGQQCSIMAGSYRHTDEEGWQNKNRKYGTPVADNYVAWGVSAKARSGIDARRLRRGNGDVKRNRGRKTRKKHVHGRRRQNYTIDR